MPSIQNMIASAFASKDKADQSAKAKLRAAYRDLLRKPSLSASDASALFDVAGKLGADPNADAALLDAHDQWAAKAAALPAVKADWEAKQSAGAALHTER